MTPNDVADIRTQLRRIADALEEANDRRTFYQAVNTLPDLETR
jgi:hypothetical protein